MQNLLATLTERETQVYNLLAAGWSNKEIGAQLGIGVSGVKFHVSRVLVKLGVSGRAGAIAYGVGSREIAAPLIGDGGLYSEEQIRRAGLALVDLGLGNRKEVNETVINLLSVLGGKMK